MKSHSCSFTALLACLSLLLIPLSVTAAATGPLRYTQTPSPPSSTSWGAAFPGLRWLRDSAVELIFGSSARSKDTARDVTTWAAVRKQYADTVVVRYNVTDRAEEEALGKFVDMFFLDVWASVPGEYVDVAMSREKLGRPARAWLPRTLHEPFVVEENVAERVWATYPHGKKVGEGRVGGRERGGIEEWEEVVARDAVGRLVDGVDNMFFRDYQPLSVITSWLKLLEAMFPSYVDLITIGTSYEGRDILGVRMGARSDKQVSSDKRKTVLITGGIHAREWISTSSVNYLIWSLTMAYDKDTLVNKFLEHYDVVLVPVVNPDGYVYTWSSDRLWRKSRQQTKMDVCPGLDLDHNFGYEWAGEGVVWPKSDPCSENYGGDKPFQAVEAAQLADWATNQTEANGVKFVGLLDLHSYSQQILYPYSYSCAVDPPNRENLEELAVGLSKAIRLSSGELYSVESACEGAVGGGESSKGSMLRVEQGGGSFMDWFYHEMAAHFSYQVKLRDTGSYGFLLPPENIVPTGEEMYAAVRYFADYLLGNNGREKSAMAEDSSEPEKPVAASDDGGTGEWWTELRRRTDV